MRREEAHFVLYEEEYQKITAVLDRLLKEANAKALYLVDRNGQLVAQTGQTENIDSTALASLTAGNIAATGGLAKLLGEKEFTVLFHEGEKENIHISLIHPKIILVVIFDERSSLGLVRLRVKRAGEELTRIFDLLLKKSEQGVGITESPFAEITDEDIDNLFRD
jgi:predicted regulator of Ras-like GTPase activity (Roadblock/LC7/MglB family)